MPSNRSGRGKGPTAAREGHLPRRTKYDPNALVPTDDGKAVLRADFVRSTVIATAEMHRSEAERAAHAKSFFGDLRRCARGEERFGERGIISPAPTPAYQARIDAYRRSVGRLRRSIGDVQRDLQRLFGVRLGEGRPGRPTDSRYDKLASIAASVGLSNEQIDRDLQLGSSAEAVKKRLRRQRRRR